MSEISQVFWRSVTKADFFNVERDLDTGPSGGGGQLYFSISFTESMSPDDLGNFLGHTPPSDLGTKRPEVEILVESVHDPGIQTPLHFRARYRPPHQDGRYYIARQNRRRASSERPPAWMPESGFPSAPPTISSPLDPDIPDLSYLKIYVARLSDVSYMAGFTNSPILPMGLPHELSILFERNEHLPANGIIDLEDPIQLTQWQRLFGGGATWRSMSSEPDEVFDAIEATRRSAGKRGRGQGFRQSYPERRAIELRAMAIAEASLIEDGWAVEDVSASRSFDFLAKRDAEEMHVEVKGTTSDGGVVLLTPNEVDDARDERSVSCLVVVHSIRLGWDETGEPVADGGEMTAILPWSIDRDGLLTPTGYAYTLSK